MTSAVRFFYKHAGYSVANGETREQGRWRGARDLASAEVWASDQGYVYDWEGDDITSFDFAPDEPERELYVCLMRSPSGVVVQSLCGIDLAHGFDAFDPYVRVVQAELADQQRSELDIREALAADHD